MRKSELIRRIKAGADVYARIPIKRGKDWVYAKLDSDELLKDLLEDREMPHCDAGANLTVPVWMLEIEK